ncbi:MAG: ammonia-dependent NAD(+) synthetase [Haliea sp.]|nr:MAG: ammonia-dependent NAD(+) synthetase [Haliea sp.]
MVHGARSAVSATAHGLSIPEEHQLIVEQRRIADDLGVPAAFDAAQAITLRTAFLADYAQKAGAQVLVLGISGGVDSTVTGRLCQLAVEQMRQAGSAIRFVAVRLPYGVQADEAEAQAALEFIRPDETLTVNVKAASDAAMQACIAAGLTFRDAAHQDFVLGNIKARQRMVAQYAIAGARGGLVVGTDHAAEAVMGFFTKFGDGGFDLTPLGGLTKRRVRAVALELGAATAIAMKQPTADLETLRPLLPDEHALGVTYDQIDAFLEGLEVDPQAAQIIVDTYRRTAHKRALPASPADGA